MNETAATPRIPWRTGLNGYHYLVLSLACMGWLFDTMDQWLYVLARQPAITDLLKSTGAYETDAALNAAVADHSGWVQMIFIFGWATGGLFFGIIGDRLGRTRTMAVTVLMYAIFTGLSGLAGSWQTFALFRFLCGFGIGGEFAAGAALISEAFPNHARATALSVMQASSALGNIMAGLISLTVFRYVGAEDSWRYVFYVGFAPALLIFGILAFVHEPEQWKHAKAQAAKGDIKLGSVLQMFADPILRRNVLVGISLAAVGVVGFWGIGTFSPDLLRGAINPDNLPELKSIASQKASVAVMFQNAGAFFGILLWGWLALRIGRKYTFALTFIACTIAVPLTFHLTTSFTMALLLFPIMGFCTTALFGGYAVYFPELFPTRLRATGTGFSYNVARYVSMAGPAVFGTLRARLQEGMGMSAADAIAWAASIMSVVFLLGLLVLPFAPETKDKPLMD
ncbi:MAG: MFS transporter [Candidatus Hydrogenedentes bacterium]|nr:MFS transporter [Candidatus Hydrogenedentota bacterium]